jgi:hypothetical protein
MDFFNHEASQSNYGACLSAAGDKAVFMRSAFADVKMLQFNSSELAPNIIKMTLSDNCQKAKTIVVLVVCFSRPNLRRLPHIEVGEPLFQEPYGSIQKYMDE